MFLKFLLNLISILCVSVSSFCIQTTPNVKKCKLKVILGFPKMGSVVKKKIHLQCRSCRFNPWLEKIPWEGHGKPHQPICQCRRHKRCGFHPWVRKITWRRAWQNHSSILAWRIPWTQEPGKLQSIWLQRVRCDWRDLACTTIILLCLQMVRARS